MCVLFNNSISSQIYAKCFVLNVSFLEENPGLRSPNQGRRSKMKVICLYLSSARLSHRVCLLGCPLTTDPVEGRLSSNLHQSPCSGRKKIPRSNTCEMFIIVITLIIHEIIGIRCCLLPPHPFVGGASCEEDCSIHRSGHRIWSKTFGRPDPTTESAALLFIGDKHSLKQSSALRRRWKD